jgi:hypothetical protein
MTTINYNRRWYESEPSHEFTRPVMVVARSLQAAAPAIDRLQYEDKWMEASAWETYN